MNKEDYLKKVIDQIRCQKAKDMISEEIENHIDDQAKAYMDMGIEETKAISMAVKEMGDPVDTGVSLDRIHRPKMAWDVLLLIGIISIISVFVQFLINDRNMRALTYDKLYNQLIFVGLGFAVMLIVYFVDYSVIGKYSKEIGALFCVFIFLQVFFFGITINGSTSYISIANLNISMVLLMYLYGPIYAGILYQYRGEGYRALIKSLVWLIIPVYLTIRMSSLSLAFNLFLVLFLTLTVAIIKDWFIINKRVVLLMMWGIVIILPIIVVVMVLTDKQSFLEAYQAARIKSYFNLLSGDAGYQITAVRELVSNSKIMGMNSSAIQTYDYLADINSDYILTHVISYYGILAAIPLVGLMALLIRKIFRISFKQKNQLGMIMGCACGMAFIIQVITYVLQNLGLWPSGTVFLPLFSYGGTGTIVSYGMLGILLSIYRHQNIIPVKGSKRKRTRLIFVRN